MNCLIDRAFAEITQLILEDAMKAFIISGSRNPEGQTATAIKAFVQGFKDTGKGAEICYLPTLDIQRCRQCEDNGWGICRAEGKCIIEDDFASVANKLLASDLVVLATPVYFADLSESLRAFLDRYRRLYRGAFANGEIEEKPTVLLCVAGGGGGGAPECIESMKRAIQATNMNCVEDIPVKRQNLDEKTSEILRIGSLLGTSSFK